MKLHKALTHEVDDYLDARIKFLRHQVLLYMLGRIYVNHIFSTLESTGENKNFKRNKMQAVSN